MIFKRELIRGPNWFKRKSQNDSPIVSLVNKFQVVLNCEYRKFTTWDSEFKFAQVDPVVTIENGKIMGREGRTTNRNVPYYAFQGIPYAEPPVGNLRFQVSVFLWTCIWVFNWIVHRKSPLPAPNWTGILNAQQDKAICIQLETATASALDSSVIEEDCLYINVYTPSVSKQPPPIITYWNWESI